jgi:cytoskeletal protein CcmA (bactofilin family)
MSSSYVNDLRLEEIGTGEQSGTWGATTNTNLELIGEAFGYGTEGITTNADTHTSTIADGATDPVRAMFVKYTGTLDSACTITIAPNTVNRMQFIENATSGSQNIIISQGSGANITIPAGDVKAVYLDGAGSGAAVVDAFASLSVVDLKVQDDLTVTGDLDVDGTTNLDAVDIDGAVQIDGTVTVGVDDTGLDVKFFGATSGAYMLWDESADDLKLVGAAGLTVAGDIDIDGTTNLDAVDIDGAVQIDGTVTVGVDDTGLDVKFFGATSGAYMLWDESADDLKLVGAAGLTVAGDIDVDGTTNLDAVDIDGAVQLDSTLSVGVDGTGHDVKFFGDTASAYMLWDQSRDDLILGGAAQLGIGTATPGHPLHIVESADGPKIRLTRGGLCEWDISIGSTSTLSGVGSGALELLPQNSGTANEFAIGQAGTTTAIVHVKHTGTTITGTLECSGALSKGSGSFKIDHPLEAKKDTHHLIHSFIEGPQADLIYRGTVDLSSGSATINIDTAAGMTDGTFVLLCRDVQCFTTNEDNWDLVKGSVSGNTLTITSQNSSSTATISWLVIGERKDEHMIETGWTDSQGRVIVEPSK